ncbi:hypothetical protein Tco_0028022, partial [Tanacetum coccineum]
MLTLLALVVFKTGNGLGLWAHFGLCGLLCIRMRREGVLLLRGLDSRLTKDLPSDLQKLRCK